MPVTKKFRPGQVYHVYNQGNNRQLIFFEPANYRFFLEKVRRHILPYADLLCYCLMPNHFHLLLVPNELAALPSPAVKPRSRLYARRFSGSSIYPREHDSDFQENLSHAFAILLSSYTRAINVRYQRSGSLFRAKTKVKDGWIDGLITLEGRNRHLFFRPDNDYARQCFHYIHANPVAARLATNPCDWPYSSAREYSGATHRGICNLPLARAILGGVG